MNKLRAIGKNIKFLRESRGYSQEILGLKAGFHRTYIGAVERGERNLSITNLCQLASALRVNPSVLLLDDSFDWDNSGKK